MKRGAAPGDDNGSDTDNDDGALTVHFTLKRNLRKRLDHYLCDRLPYMSRSQLQRLIAEQAVTVNGKAPKPATILHLGDEVSVVVPPPPSSEIPAEEIPLDVLHEDDDIIVLNKQAGIIVHPARGNKHGTLINALAFHFQNRSSGRLSKVGREHTRPGVVHRLDRNTTGVIVAAKSDTAHWRLGKQFEKRTTDKRYLAVVHGTVEPVMDSIDLPIGKHPTIRELQAVRFDDTSKTATTVYRLRQQFDGYALLELELKTGRTHQIRVHLAYLGWPIVGDDMYGGSSVYERDLIPAGASPDRCVIDRQALHATTLAFRHPASEEPVQFVAPLHDDMRALLALLGRYLPGDTGPISPPGATIDLAQILAVTE